MYNLIRSTPLRRLLAEQPPALLAAFLIAELFYKFGSFALECVAFLATWFVIDAALSIARNRRAVGVGRGPEAPSGAACHGRSTGPAGKGTT